MMKQLYSFALLLAFSICLNAQTRYNMTYTVDGGNPGGLNTGNDDAIAGWTTIISPSIATNQWSSAVSIPFTFLYYGNAVTELKASANGLITFNTAAVNLPGDNDNLPSAQLPDSTIACFWDAFTALPPTASNDNVVYQTFGTAPNRQLWIKWTSYEMGAGPVSYTNIACVLEETTNNIYLVEGYTPGTPLQTTTVGLQLNATTAIQSGTKNRPQTLNTSNTTTDNDYFTFTPYTQAAMSILSTNCDQPLQGNVSNNAQNEGILRIAITTLGELTPLSISQFDLTTIGTTSLLDLSNAKLFYTGNSPELNTKTQFGSTVTSPAATFTISGSQQLAPGVNYFWLTYSIPNSASLLNIVDAECLQMTIASTSYFPTTASPIGSRTINAGLSGVVTVGTGSTYTHLSDAFKAINTFGLSGNLTLSITSNITDTANAILQYHSPNPYSIRIVPSTDSLRTIKGNFTDAYIQLKGTQKLTIDGTGPISGIGKYLRFLNINDFGPTIALTDGAFNDTIQNCIVEGAVAQQDRGVITLSSSAFRTISQIYIAHNEIRDRSDSLGIPTILIYSSGVDLYPVSNVTINDNQLFNFRRSGVFVAPVGNGGNWNITGNHFYYNASTSPAGGDIVTIMLIPGINAEENTISGNYIGGQAPFCGGSAWLSANGVNWVAMNINSGLETGTSVQGNTIQNVNLTTTATVDFAGIRIESGKVDVGTIIGNTIGHPSTPNSIQNSARLTLCIYGFTSTLGDITIANNTIANITGLGTTTAAGVRGISIQGGVSPTNIYNNTIYNLSSTATNTNALTSTAMGIGLNSGSNASPCIIRNNTVYNISASAASANTIPSGIIVDNGSSNGLVENNTIYNITNPSSGASAFIHGLYIAGGVVNWTVRNNMISLNNGTNTNAMIIRGISDNASGNSVSYYNNSVYIGGTTSGSTNSFAFERRNASSIPTLRNNILYNERTGGTGVHAAIGNVPASVANNWNAQTSGYNLLVSSSASTIGAWGSTFVPRTFAQWQDTSACDKTSWSDVSSVISSAVLFKNTATGDLRIDSTNAACWYVNGKGIALPENPLDIHNQTRNTIVTSGAQDIGADEFGTTTLPFYATVTGTIAALDSSTFTLAGRTLAKVYWNTGAFPTTINLRYYSGNYPASILTQTGSRFASYHAFEHTGAGAFDVDVKILYDSALFGTVTSTPSALLLASGSSSSLSWNVYSTNTVVNATEQSLMVENIAAIDLFTGTQVSSPLDITLVSFKGNVQQQHAQLNWQSAAEVNAKAYIVERSTNGTVFESIATVKAANKPYQYAYTDFKVFENNKQAYYRLKMVDNDGSFEYSKVIVLQNGLHKNFEAAVFPNPYTSETKLSFNSEQESFATLTVSDVQGKIVWSKTLNTQTGLNTLSIDLESAQQGVYFVHLKVGTETYQSKLIK